ncbi:MAG: GLPGLI family protein [Psychroflexus sp.]
MKIFIYFISLLSYFYSYSQNFSGEIEYGVDYIGFSKDTSKIESIDYKESFLNFENQSKSYLKNDKAFTKLKFNNQYATYQIIENLEMDDSNNAVIEIVALQTDNYYIDIENSKKYQYGKFKGKTVLVEFERDYSWEIVDEYKNILGFRCQKAVSKVGDPYEFGFAEAWFTTEIPVSIGPHSYTDLPGIILGLKVKGRHIYALDINISENDNLNLEENLETFTQDEYREMKKKGY